MSYMQIHCKHCRKHWKVNFTDNWKLDAARTCPHCGMQIDYQTWERQVLPAFGAFHDANFELARDATGYYNKTPFTVSMLLSAEDD